MINLSINTTPPSILVRFLSIVFLSIHSQWQKECIPIETTMKERHRLIFIGSQTTGTRHMIVMIFKNQLEILLNLGLVIIGRIIETSMLHRANNREQGFMLLRSNLILKRRGKVHTWISLILIHPCSWFLVTL